MKPLFTLLTLGLLCQSCNSQIPDWSRTNHWKIYPIAGQGVFKITKDSLQRLRSSCLDGDTLRAFLASSRPIPADQTPVWMGSWLSTYESSDGKVNKVEISTYGGFFYDEASSKYYEVPRDVANAWRNFISDRITGLRAADQTKAIQ
jgi:hypothetical protein